jgi:hypothetical protein
VLSSHARSMLGACSEHGPSTIAKTAYNCGVLALFQTVTPVVELPPSAPATEVGPADVLIGSIGLVGVMAVFAVLAGLAFGALFILRRQAADRAATGPDESEATQLRLSGPPSGTP